jgi:hypothetical protein
MVGLLFFLLRLLLSPFRPISRLEADNAALRCQLMVLQRQVRGRVQFTNSDRPFFLQLYRWFPSIVKAMTTIRPETLVRWHRAGFCRYWRWKSRNLGGRPPIDAGLASVVRRRHQVVLPAAFLEQLGRGFVIFQCSNRKLTIALKRAMGSIKHEFTAII